jgi:hypothetical protein
VNAMIDPTSVVVGQGDDCRPRLALVDSVARASMRRSVGYRDSLHMSPGSSTPMFIACVIAQAFSRGTPTVEQLCDRFGMHRSTAYRWRKAWVDAMGVEPRASAQG